MKKYLSLIGIAALTLIVGWLGYQALFSYLAEHTYYFGMLASSQNRRVFISAILCTLLPIGCLFISSKANIKSLLITFLIGAGVFGIVHSNIKGDPVGLFGNAITLFNTLLLVGLGLYLILGFSALGSWIERKWIKFNKLRRQEIFLSFGIGFCSFVIIVQILLGIGLLYGIVSWLLFLGLGFMIRYERTQLKKWREIIGDIFDRYKEGVLSGEKLGKKIGLLFILLPIVLSLAYLYIGIQNAFVPYSTAWDANHEYMYIPKILAENTGIYRGNTVANSMPGFWHQFLTFIFSLTGCTNGWFGLSSDNIAISMNNISASMVLIFGVAIIFQIFTLVNSSRKNDKDEEESGLKKGKNTISEAEVSNGNGITMGRYILLLWLTGGMGAFLVIVDNKTDLGVMALSLLALLAGLIFLQNRKSSNDKKEILKYVLIAGLFFGFAALAKITAFVDLILFGLLLVGLRFSSLTSLGLGIMVMGFARKFNILTANVMLTDENATWLLMIGGVITFIGLVIHLLKNSNREKFGKDLRDLIILGIGFLLPLVIFKLPRTTIGQLKTDSYSLSNSLRGVFLSINTNNEKENSKKFLAQNIEIEEINDSEEISDSDISDSIEQQNEIDLSVLNSRNDKNFNQCSSAGDIYSDEELNENLQELNGGGGGEDLGRYIGYGWEEFKKVDIVEYDAGGTGDKKAFNFFKALWPKMTGDSLVNNLTENQALYLMRATEDNVIFESNLSYGLLKLIWPTSDTCYGFNHDAKILCNNSGAIDNFKIDDLRGIYENGINNKEGEAGKLLKAAIDAYDEKKSEGKISGASNSALFHDEIVNLRQYYQSHSILSTEDSIYIPYRYLVPFNITFNWSLQNLSSYYTDIGFFWIIVYVFLIIALPYAIIKRDKLLTSISLTTLIGWVIRWIIGSSILWYGTVLISWTMITLAIFWENILKKDKKSKFNFISWILIVVVGIFFSIQIIFNFLRIASQGANSVFVRYKGNIANPQIIDENLNAYDANENPITKIEYKYGWKNIFDLQFPQYNAIIEALADRDNNDGVTIAGTYIQYFLGNQQNVKFDSMLDTFRKNSSDGNLCKTYRRLRKDNTRYFIIDPNIGTVTMGEGNETLFYKFFGKLDSTKSKIDMDGAIVTLVRLYNAGYLKLLSTNNIGAKYAFSVDDETINSVFGGDLTSEQLILARSKMAVLKYFDDANSLFAYVAKIFLNRVAQNPKLGIEDIADIYGLTVDIDKIASIVNSGNLNKGFAKDLTQDERTVLLTYLSISSYIKSGNTQKVSSIIMNSITGSSQIIALELN